MNAKALWYAVYTKPRWEKKVAELLTRKGIENYCPLNKVVKQWHDRKKLVEEPLFTSYVFVYITPSYLAEVKKTAGVLNFVYWLGKPAIIRAEEIITIQKFLNEYKAIQLQKVAVSPADTVQVISGPLMSLEGTVLEVFQKKVKVILPSLGYAMVAELERTSIEVISAKSTLSNSQLPPSSLKNFKIA
ncbi:MAG: UpxY family transcription antiterminator [Chitinophagaceae bacterium]|nr:MAG: UpxY family transcription antiterminator [Chitinophagaceae bacterium]